jgi:hypothetical protein
MTVAAVSVMQHDTMHWITEQRCEWHVSRAASHAVMMHGDTLRISLRPIR